MHHAHSTKHRIAMDWTSIEYTVCDVWYLLYVLQSPDSMCDTRQSVVCRWHIEDT